MLKGAGLGVCMNVHIGPAERSEKKCGFGGGGGGLRSSLKIIFFSLLSELWHKGHGNIAVEEKR